MEIPEEIKLFLLESYENLDKVEQDLLALEKDPSNAALLNSVFRCIHTIKGNSGFLGLSTLEVVCHKGEAVLERLRSGALKFTEGLNSDLLDFIDFVRLELQGVESSGQDPNLASEPTLHRLSEYLN
jgi:two-component system chemotaxis sensor kinase CheA